MFSFDIIIFVLFQAIPDSFKNHAILKELAKLWVRYCSKIILEETLKVSNETCLEVKPCQMTHVRKQKLLQKKKFRKQVLFQIRHVGKPKLSQVKNVRKQTIFQMEHVR